MTTTSSNNNDENNNTIEFESSHNFNYNPNQFNTGLFDCHEDIRLCLEATFCLPCAVTTREVAQNGCAWLIFAPLIVALTPISMPFMAGTTRTENLIVTRETS